MVSANFLFQALFAGAAVAGSLFQRQDQCTSDDACEGTCRAVEVRGEGVDVTPNEAIIADARRRFQDFHCVDGGCQCALTSDDQAQDFCKYWIETSRDEFNGARYVDGYLNADEGVVVCVFATG